MIFNTITLILALAPATLFAAPTPTFSDSFLDTVVRRNLSPDQVKKLTDGVCDLTGVTMPIAPTPLPSPAAGLTLAHVALGRGTQNYTCKTNSKDEKPTAVGAVAQLYNVTCQAARAPAILADITKYALGEPLPSSAAAEQLLSGHHEFTADSKPLFVLDTDAHKWGYIIGKKAGNSTAPATAVKGPNGMGSVLWLKLTAAEGDYKEVYRINTAGGMNWPDCEGRQGDYQVQYATEYWFWK